jgi:hypothetical protein
MIKLKGALVPEEEFYCTTLREAARILNVIGLLARVYGRPEPVRFLGVLGRSLSGVESSPPHRSPRGRDRSG